MEIHLIPVWHFKSLHEIHLTAGEKSSLCMIVCYLGNVNMHLWVSGKRQAEKETAIKQFATMTKRDWSKVETLIWFITRRLSHAVGELRHCIHHHWHLYVCASVYSCESGGQWREYPCVNELSISFFPVLPACLCVCRLSMLDRCV